MTHLSHLGRSLTYPILALSLLAASSSAFAQDHEYVLLADSVTLADAIHDELQFFLAEVPNDIEIDEQQQALFTEEGERIDFSTIFNQKRLRGSKAVSVVFEEYAPEYLVLAWHSQKSKSDPAYSVSKIALTVNLRVLDNRGRNVHDGSASAKSKLGVTKPALEELLADAVASLNFVQLENAIAKDSQRKQKRGQPVKIVFENVSQKDYFEKRDNLVALLKASGSIDKMRDKHDKSKKVLTVRATLKGDLDAFYRNLYRSALDLDGLDNFELDRKGSEFVFTAVPANRKRLIISGLSPEQYHHRLEVYRDAVLSVEGTKQVEFTFVRSQQDADSKLIFIFTYRDDIHVFEEQLWKSLERAGEAINRQLAAVSDNSIQYIAGVDSSDLRQVTLRVQQVSRNAFRGIDPALEQSLKQFSVRNLRKSYDDGSLELSYSFKIEDSTEFLATSIQSAIESTPALERLVIQSIGSNLLAYNYEVLASGALPVTIELRDLPKQDYQTIGHEFAALVEHLDGVERFRESYSTTDHVLKLNLRYQGKTSLSHHLHRLILQSSSLAGLNVTQGSGKITLTALPPERRRLVITGLSAERYHHRLEAYRSAVGSQTGVSELNHEYLAGSAGAPGQLVFSFSFSGNLADLEGRIWASLADAGETPNRQLSAVSERLIQYQAGGEVILTALFRNVVPAQYSRIRESLDQIFGTLEVRNLTRDYDDKAQVLSYRFESGQAMVDLDAALEQQVAATPALQGLVPGAATDTSLEYSYRKTIVTVAFNNIAPGDYRKVGELLDNIMKNLDVKNLRKSYDPDVYRLSYTLESPMPPVDLDTLLWEKIRRAETLSDILQDATSANTLGYFYQQQRPKSLGISVVLKNIGPDLYRKAGRRFITLVKVIDGVNQLRQEYSESDQTLRLRFRYQGESIYSIDDALWKAVKRDESLASLALSEMTENELVYVLGAKDSDRRDILIHMRGVDGTDYKLVSTSFATLLKRIKNVRDVTYHYVFDRRTVVFKLRYEGESRFKLEAAILEALLGHELLQGVSKGPDTVGRMIYLYEVEAGDTLGGKPAADATDTNKASLLTSSTSLPDLVAALDKSVILILGETADSRWHGTGFFVSDSGYLLTNAHVAMGHLVHKQQAKLWAKTLDGQLYALNVIKSDNEQDLALLKIVSPTRLFESVRIGNSSQVRKGQQVFNIGNPGTWDEYFEHSVTIGVVAGLNRNDGLIEFSMPGRGGQSGSPVFNSQGEVVGVVVKVTLDNSGKALIPILVADTDTSGDASFKVENKLIDIMTRNETITMGIPINHARNLLVMARE